MSVSLQDTINELISEPAMNYWEKGFVFGVGLLQSFVYDGIIGVLKHTKWSKF